MNRSLKLSMLLALALGSSQAAALELGQIQVKSALGQPLLAEIPVNPDSPAELQNLTSRGIRFNTQIYDGLRGPTTLLYTDDRDLTPGLTTWVRVRKTFGH